MDTLYEWFIDDWIALIDATGGYMGIENISVERSFN